MDTPLSLPSVPRFPAQQQGTRRETVSRQRGGTSIPAGPRPSGTETEAGAGGWDGVSPGGGGPLLPLTVDSIKKGSVPEPERVPGRQGAGSRVTAAQRVRGQASRLAG